MTDYQALLRIFSIPRHNGSPAERRTRQVIVDWLNQRDIPHQLQSFRLYPYFMPAIGVWLIFSRTLLALSIWLRWGWPAAPIAIIGLVGGLVDVVLGFPLVTWPGATQGQNILITYQPDEARHELLLSAHYDTKTELLDHRQRMVLIRSLPIGIAITIILGVLGPLDTWLQATGSAWAQIGYLTGVALSLPMLVLAWGIGLNTTLGGLRPPSQGAVDNGAACAILLGLAERIRKGDIPFKHTRLTLALFTGEEAQMQGSRAYTAGRDWDLPAMAINLEVMAQDGDYVFWEQDGTSLNLVPTSNQINQALVDAVTAVTGAPARGVGPVNSDGYSFLRVGVPATTLGTYDSLLVDRGFHSSQDNLERVVMARLPEAVNILIHVINKLEDGSLQPSPKEIAR